MNKDIVVTLDRTNYRWIYDPQAAVSSSWTWRNEQTNMVPTPQIESRLNRYLLDHHATSFRDTWGKADLPRFHEVLRSLGASRDEVIKLDQGSLSKANPDGVPSADAPKTTAKATSRKRIKKSDK